MWESLVWTLVLYGLAGFVIWWVWHNIKSKVSEPFRTPIEVIGYVVAGLFVAGILLSRIPLIPCCVLGGVQLF